MKKKQTGGLYDTNKAAYVDSVFDANKDLNFVKRYQHPKDYPTIKNPDGTVSTLKMESGDTFVNPTIFQMPDGSLKDMNKMNAMQRWDYARSTGQYIDLKDPERATWFANNGYKLGKQFNMGGKLKKAQIGLTVPEVKPVMPPTIEDWYDQHPNEANYRPITPMPETSRQFNPFQPNAWGLGLMGAYLGSKALLNKSNENHYEAYKRRWIRDYNIPSLIQDPNKFSSTMYEAPMARKGGIMQDGGKAPIYTSDKNDPRLRAYQDSLTLYKDSPRFYGSRDPDSKTEMKQNIANEDTVGPLMYDGPKEAYSRLSRYNNKSPIPTYKEVTGTSESYLPDDPNYFAVRQDFKKPVQPVMYRKRINPKAQIPTSNNDMSIGQRPNAGAFNPPELYDPNDPTSYSYTTKGEGYNEQNVQYLPDQKSWQQFLRGKKVASSQQGKGYGTATGYQTGGIARMTPEQIDYFNNFNAYVEKQGLKGSKKLNNQDFSRNLYKQYQTQNPGTLSYEQLIPMAQQEQYIQKDFDTSFAQRKNLPAADSIAKGAITPYDGLYGPLTSSRNIPKAFQQTFNNNKLVQSGELGYVPQTINTTMPGKSKIPKGVSLEDAIDSAGVKTKGYTDPSTGDWVPVEKLKDGGLSRAEDYGSKKKPYPSVKSGDFAGGHRSYPIPTRADAIDALRLAGLHGRADVKAKVYAKYPDLKKQMGGLTMNTPEDQGAGYFKYPNASSLTFPGKGQRTFVPGPFPLMVQDQNGTQLMTNKPVRTMGAVREIPIYEEGGEVRKQAITVDREDATIEAERGELILGAGMPGDVEDQEDRVGVGLYKVGGKKHSAGGTPLKAYPGDFVFSDDKDLAVTEEESKLLIGKEIKKLKQRTPAKLASKFMDLNKFIDMAQDEDQDPISKKTAILNVNNFIDRLAEIALVQEEKKGFPDGVPQFVQTSLDTRFSPEGLQEELNAYRYGGQVKKYQDAGLVTPEIRAKARLVDKAPEGYKPFGTFGDKQYYRNAQGELVSAPNAIPGGTPGKPWEDKMISLLQSGVTIEELAKQKHGTVPELTRRFGKYYVPRQTEEYAYTPVPGDLARYDFPTMDRGPLPTAPNKPGVTPTTNAGLLPEDDPLDQYTQGSNSRFNLNTAEAYNLLASALPEDSRYPPAFRNYEIQNAKALVAGTGRPISEQPYLNAIARSTLGRDDLGSFQASLGAQNQAISQVYNQNIQRADQRDMRLAELEVQDGVDRTTQAEKYDNKLEMLANNKELARRYRRQNIGLQLNQMQKDRESKSLFNVMSDTYQINRDNTIGMKPTYKIIDGKIVPYQRTMADLIKSAGQSTNTQYLERMKGIFDLMNQYGIRSGGSFVDDLIRESAIPPQAATGK